MRILVNDFAGHPFQLQLSRELARRGNPVLHTYCSSIPTTPQAAFQTAPLDPHTFAIKPIQLSEPLEKGTMLKRRRQENEFGRRMSAVLEEFCPDVIVSANTPLDAQRRLLRSARKIGAGFVFWAQDLIGYATGSLLSARLGPLAKPVGSWYRSIEAKLFRASDAIVAITDDFVPILRQYGVADDAVSVIENWAPLDEFPQRARDADWAKEHGLAGKRILLYSGTLGMKHNPAMLVDLADGLADREDVRIVVVSSGAGADWIKRESGERGLTNMVLLGFQPYSDLPSILGTADILLALLEADAGVCSVPSKVLTYHCAGRPLLLAVPPENLVARIVTGNRSGLVVPPGDSKGFVESARHLLDNPESARNMGVQARAYAELTFDIKRIADSFEEIILRAGSGEHSPREAARPAVT